MELLKRVHAQNLVAWAKDRPEVVVLSADLTSSCEADLFRDTYPDRFYSFGLSEQNMLSVAGGMAREGLYPLCTPLPCSSTGGHTTRLRCPWPTRTSPSG